MSKELRLLQLKRIQSSDLDLGGVWNNRYLIRLYENGTHWEIYYYVYKNAEKINRVAYAVSNNTIFSQSHMILNPQLLDVILELGIQ